MVNQLFQKNKAIKDELKECLDDLEGINRLAYSQYGKIVLGIQVSSDNEISGFSSDEIKKIINELEPEILKELHQKMYDKYNRNIIHKMTKVKTYLLDKQNEL